MANFGKIEITFTDYTDVVIGENLTAYVDRDAEGFYLELYAATVRSIGRFKVGTTNESTATNYAAALLADYGLGGAIEQHPINVTVVGAVVTIIFESYDYTFVDFVPYSYNEWYDVALTQPVLPDATFALDYVGYFEATTNPNVNVRRKIFVTNANYPVTITYPVTKVCATQSDLWFETLRSWSGNVLLTDDSDNDVIAPALAVDTWTIREVSLLYGIGTVNARVDLTVNFGDVAINYEYSIDGTNWQTGNIFYGLFIDTYTVYVRDDFGGTDSESFEITAIPNAEKPEPFFSISENQSLHFKELDTFDGDSTFAHQFNSLYYQQTFKNRDFKDFCQHWNQSDILTVQVRSTYKDVDITLIDSDGEDVVVYHPTLARQYIGLTDMRDCTLIDAGNNQTFMYFTTGHKYDYDTLAINGEYSLAGKLEPWMYDVSAIQNVQILGTASMNGQYEIAGRNYDPVNKVSVLVLNLPFNDVNALVGAQVKFRYNAEDFDVYETEIPMAALSGNYHVEVEASDTDPRYTDKVWISEPFNVEVKHADNVLIEWTDTRVIGDLDFSTGIENRLRIEAVFLDFDAKGDKETMEDDQGRIIPLKAIKRKMKKLQTSYLPPYMVDKLTTAISMHDSVIINSLPVQTSDFGEIETAEKNSMVKLMITCQYNETITYFDDNSVFTSASGNNVLGVSDEQVMGV